MLKLSVITICYNEPNLEQTCESIVNQTFQDFEWIVVDGGSNQAILDIFEKYKNRINKFVSEPDTGRYNAMNKGIKMASGQYLNFLHAGDSYFYNDALKDIFGNKEYQDGVLYGQECVVTDNPLGNYIHPMPLKITKEFLYFASIRHQASFIRKDLFEQYGLYNENYVGVSDHEKFLIFLQNDVSFKYLPYTVTNFNTQGFSSKQETKTLADTERENLLKQFFSDSEINELAKTYTKDVKTKYNFLEMIFSVKNDASRVYKMITILGIHIKILRK